MQILQEKEKQGFNFQYVPLIGGLSALLSIIVGYVIAVNLGHVEPFPKTDITHTTIKYPEYYFARIGFPTACVLISLTWFILVYFFNTRVQYINNIQNKKRTIKQQLAQCQPNTTLYNNLQQELNTPQMLQIKKDEAENLKVPQGIILWLGNIACLLLLLSIVVVTESDMDWTLHIVGATGFFIFVGINFLYITSFYNKIWEYWPNFVSNFSIQYKNTAVYIFKVTVVLLIMEPLPQFHDYFPDYFGNYVEWGLVAVVLVYITTMAQDFKNINLYFEQNFE